MLFIGEVALGTFIFARPDRLLRPWLSWLLGRGPRCLVAMAWALVFFFFYGVLQALRGWLILGHEPIVVLQNSVFNIYPLHIFWGVWIGQAHDALLRSVLRWLSWINGIYGSLYILVLNRLDLSLPWAPSVPLFGQPGGSAVALLGLLSLEPRPMWFWPLLLLNLLVLLGLQVRGEWLAFGLGLLIWLALRRDLSRFVLFGTMVILTLFLMYTFELRIPAPQLRGGEISLRGVTARVLAPLNAEAAAELIGEQAYSLAGTITGWRVAMWQTLWTEVHRDSMSALLGLGYGYPLYRLLAFLPEGNRTPHNAFFYALSYGGWLGAMFFFAFQFALGYTIYRATIQVRNPFGLALWIGLFASAFFGNFFETPFNAVPFYLLMGYNLAPLTENRARGSVSRPLPTARR